MVWGFCTAASLSTACRSSKQGRVVIDSGHFPFIFLHRKTIVCDLAAEADVTRQSMLTHAEIWTAIERLAARSGLSASGLAKKSGLDPTTFNKSKRITPDGRPRWPSTESVAKALDATGTDFATFVSLISEGGAQPPAKQVIPL